MRFNLSRISIRLTIISKCSEIRGGKVQVEQESKPVLPSTPNMGMKRLDHHGIEVKALSSHRCTINISCQPCASMFITSKFKLTTWWPHIPYPQCSNLHTPICRSLPTSGNPFVMYCSTRNEDAALSKIEDTDTPNYRGRDTRSFEFPHSLRSYTDGGKK